MANVAKSVKEAAREARNRLGSGYWQKLYREREVIMEKAKAEGISESKVKEYYADIAEKEIKGKDLDFEAFYQNVKRLLDAEGEVGNALGRLTDKAYYESLTYEQRQKYNLNLSEKYIRSLERYYREKKFEDIKQIIIQ